MKPVTAAILCSGGRPRFYRRPAAVDSNLPRHIQWHAVSRKLLGLPAMKLPAPDYVSSFNVWDPEVLRAMLGQVERVTGRHWMDAVTSQPSFSEWTLYGVYVDEFVPDDGRLSVRVVAMPQLLGPHPADARARSRVRDEYRAGRRGDPHPVQVPDPTDCSARSHARSRLRRITRLAAHPGRRRGTEPMRPAGAG